MALILVVDDDLDILKTFQRDLMKQGHQVICATNGSEAWQNLFNPQPDLIILDIAIPGMSGIELCRKIRANPMTAATPIIFATVSNDMGSQSAAFDAGADDYLIKPFNLTEFNLRVHALLRDHSRSARS